MEQINDGARAFGVFDVDAIRGVRGELDPIYKRAMLDEGGREALIEHYIKRMGGSHFDHIVAPNRLVTDGLALIINFLKGTGGTTVPTMVQLGSGSTGAGSWAKTLTAVRTVISSGGLAENAADSITIGTTTDTGDKLTFVNDFTATADFGAGVAPDEVAIRSTVPKCLCYAPFPSGERTLLTNDHLIVTYNFTLVP